MASFKCIENDQCFQFDNKPNSIELLLVNHVDLYEALHPQFQTICCNTVIG